MDYIKGPNLVLDLPLYLLDAASFADRSAYGHTCAVTTATWTPRGYTFTAATPDYITIPDHSALEPTTAITIEAWVNVSDNTVANASISQKRAGANEYSHLFRIDGGYLIFYFYTASAHGVLDATTQLANNTWYHVAATYDKANIRLYVNANQVASAAKTSAMTVNASDLTIGARSYDNAEAFGDTMGEYRMYNRALNPLELQHNRLATNWRYA